MNADKFALALAQLRIRCDLYELLISHLLLRTRTFEPQSKAEDSFRANERTTLSTLEAISQSMQHSILSSPKYGWLSAAERALYADEVHDIVGEMKTTVSDLGTGNEGEES
jgi:hypothetical protein